MATPQATSGVRIFPPAIHLASIAVGFLLQWIIPVRFGGAQRLAAVAGYVLLGIAAALIVWAGVGMSRAGTTPNPTRPTKALVTSGVFGFTRNPMYLAWELICVGLGLAANAPWVIAMAIPAALVTRRIVIDKEERYLESKFGTEYQDYKARVRRWF